MDRFLVLLWTCAAVVVAGVEVGDGEFKDAAQSLVEMDFNSGFDLMDEKDEEAEEEWDERRLFVEFITSTMTPSSRTLGDGDDGNDGDDVNDDVDDNEATECDCPNPILIPTP